MASAQKEHVCYYIPMSTVKKRKRGAQPGNHNACKHGLYAARTTPEEVAQLAIDLQRNEGAPVVILVRNRLVKVLKSNPSNTRAVREAVSIIMSWTRKQYSLGSGDAGAVRDIIRENLNSVALLAQQAQRLKSLAKKSGARDDTGD